MSAVERLDWLNSRIRLLSFQLGVCIGFGTKRSSDIRMQFELERLMWRIRGELSELFEERAYLQCRVDGLF